jgi:hypothetical protein
MVPGSFSRVKQRHVELTTHLHIVPGLKMLGAIPPLLHTSSWLGAYLKDGKIYGAVVSDRT